MEVEEQSRPRRAPLQPVVQLKARRRPDKDMLPIGTFPTFPNGWNGKQKSTDGVHRLRVDFKEDCDLENVWLMGGLSILTSVPVTTQLVCLLCASKGFHELVFCQVCCDPFHVFCLEEDEQPLPEQHQAWCCRRCKACHVCGRRSRASKHLLECERCRNCYHPACLGPNYPSRPGRKPQGWLCSACVRCKSCGAALGRSWEAEWTPETNLCPPCAVLYAQGNYCPICSHCYEDNDYESKMMQCAMCEHWVHAKCEGLSDEGYEILSSLPDSVVYACRPCTGADGGRWRDLLDATLGKGLRAVLQGLQEAEQAAPLLQCAQCSPDSGVHIHQHPCDLRSIARRLEQGHYTSVLGFNRDMVGVLQRQGPDPVGGSEPSARQLYLELMGKSFAWFDAADPKHWQGERDGLPNGLLPNAVVPPSADHLYAQWRQPEEPGPEKENEQPTPPPGVKGPGTGPGGGTEDKRQCALCLQYGDAPSKEAGRLLYIGQNEWTHVNCAVWSAEVFEENDGSLKNVHAAVARGRQMDDKKVFCPKHTHLLDGTEIVAEDGFDVLRRVYVDFEGISFKRKFTVGLEPDTVNMMIGEHPPRAGHIILYAVIVPADTPELVTSCYTQSLC
ncbi:histone-lysine N-methyltransferase 2B isoform B [Alligator mississippiensis]|uniref:Histone-lysine N-methyltransferase 2B isoform B n=1 Tax=Alligator mississippiensis TaxID=8496 RepID=A0A151PEQ6_ALLMI|nr:histone-lysine N-methyltransferase 2B isoform B [Alligator mississippiensis]